MKNAPFQKQKQSAATKAKFNTTANQLHYPHAAIWPCPGTLESLALVQLLAGNELRQDTFTASWRLAAIIYSLAGKGWPCHVRKVYRQGHANPIAAYRIDTEAESVRAAMRKRWGVAA